MTLSYYLQNTEQIIRMIGMVFFVWFDSLRPINNLSVKQGRVFQGWTSTKLRLMCLAQGPQRSDAGEVSSQALYHWATAIPNWYGMTEWNLFRCWRNIEIFGSLWSSKTLNYWRSGARFWMLTFIYGNERLMITLSSMSPPSVVVYSLITSLRLPSPISSTNTGFPTKD